MAPLIVCQGPGGHCWTGHIMRLSRRSAVVPVASARSAIGTAYRRRVGGGAQSQALSSSTKARAGGDHCALVYATISRVTGGSMPATVADVPGGTMLSGTIAGPRPAAARRAAASDWA